MKKLFINSEILDRRASEKFDLDSEILMENAAASLANFVRKNIKKGSKILGVIGGGNNGADVLAALRMLFLDYEAIALICSQNLKPLCEKQLLRARLAGVRIKELDESEIFENLGAKCVIDGLFGSGLNRKLDEKHINLIKKINALKAYKIACDVPSGLNSAGILQGACFRADLTVTMGARKLGLYSDAAKDFVGDIKLARLGISSQNYGDLECENFLLTKRDLNLPFRKRQNVNKGNFGHVFVLSGVHSGAARMAALAASAIGAGLVSIINDSEISGLETQIMQTRAINQKMNAGALGMGLGEAKIAELDFEILKDKKLVIDADLCYDELAIKLAKNSEDVVLTPHPKEFVGLLNSAGLGNFSVQQIVENRFELARVFSRQMRATLVLKGANTVIAKSGKLYVIRHGTQMLAKGGSGDVLAGLIAGLLAQGYDALEAAISGTLAHALAARKFKGASYAFSPKDIIKGVKCLQKK